MSFLDHVAACNRWNPDNFRPFVVAGERVGWVKHGFADRLKPHRHVFAMSDDGVTLAPGLDDYDSRTRMVDGVLRQFADDGVISGWRGEYYPVGARFHGPQAMAMERAAVPFFGVRAYGVHVNGFVRDGDDIHMWIARRSGGKQTFPDMLDNMIAGGQPIGISPGENVVKEAWEEAAVPAGLAARARPVGAISYCQETGHGLKPDVMFNYDLELPADFVPANTDGEVAEFYLWPVEKVIELVETTTEFKFNCNLVIIDFCIRHGLIGPDRPDYLALMRGLRG
jgi:Domain of unknown function (DUF4743)